MIGMVGDHSFETWWEQTPTDSIEGLAVPPKLRPGWLFGRVKCSLGGTFLCSVGLNACSTSSQWDSHKKAPTYLHMCWWTCQNPDEEGIQAELQCKPVSLDGTKHSTSAGHQGSYCS